jgi:hypothetical protein
MNKTQNTQPKRTGMIRAVHSGDSVTIAQGNNVERFFFANVITPHMGSP